MGVMNEAVVQPLDLRDQLRGRQLLEVDHVQRARFGDEMRQEVLAEVALDAIGRRATRRRDASRPMTSARERSSRLST